MKKYIALIALAALLVLFAGSFNSDGGTIVEPTWQIEPPTGSSAFGTYIRNFDSFTKWTVTKGTVDLYAEGDFFGDVDNGRQRFVDMAGSFDGDPKTNRLGEITSQEITVSKAGKYRLSFLLAGNQRQPEQDTVTIKVTLSGLPDTDWIIDSDTAEIDQNDPFTLKSKVYDLDPGTTQLVFTAGGFTDKDGFLLDDVNFELVPIPGAAILFSSGLIGLVCIRRKVR